MTLKKKISIIVVVILFISLVSGITIGTLYRFDKLEYFLDPGEGGIDIPTNGDDGETTFDVPVVSVDSAKITDLNEISFDFEVFVTYRSSVSKMEVYFFIDDVFSFKDTLTSLGSGFYGDSYSKSQFSEVETDSKITLDIHMTYYHLIDGVSYDVPYYDVVDEFSFVYTEDPGYVEPEIVDGSFEKSVEDPLITFKFLVSDFEHVNSISYYFEVDNEVVEGVTGEDIILEMTHEGGGVYSASFDYTPFNLEKTTYIYLRMSFENEDEIDEERIYQKFTSFEYATDPTDTTPTPTISPINGAPGYSFIIGIIAISAIALGVVIRKRRRVS